MPSGAVLEEFPCLGPMGRFDRGTIDDLEVPVESDRSARRIDVAFVDECRKRLDRRRIVRGRPSTDNTRTGSDHGPAGSAAVMAITPRL